LRNEERLWHRGKLGGKRGRWECLEIGRKGGKG
jgi:hypothetical protein